MGRSWPTTQPMSTTHLNKPISLPMTTLGIPTNTGAASAIRDTVVPVAHWWSALLPSTLLMTSAKATLQPTPSPTTSCSTTSLLVPPVGRRLIPPRRFPSRTTTTISTYLTTMVARCTVVMVPCLDKTALVVVSVITLVEHASVSVDTLALLVSRWTRWRNVSVHLACIMLILNMRIFP